MHDHIRTVLDGPQQNRRSHRVIDHQRHAMLVGHSRQSFDVRHVPCWIADALAVNRARILVDQLLDIFGAIGRGKARSDSTLRKDMRQQRVSGAI